MHAGPLRLHKMIMCDGISTNCNRIPNKAPSAKIQHSCLRGGIMGRVRIHAFMWVQICCKICSVYIYGWATASLLSSWVARRVLGHPITLRHNKNYYAKTYVIIIIKTGSINGHNSHLSWTASLQVYVHSH